MRRQNKQIISRLFVSAWLIYVGVFACRAANYGYTQDGAAGLFLGFVIGALVGAMSATIWAFIFYFLFKFIGFISQLLKRPKYK